MASAVRARDLEEAELSSILDECIRDFLNIEALRKKKKKRLVNLARGKDIFAILPTGLRKSLIFQLWQKLR